MRLKSNQRFSRSQLLIFFLVFGVVGFLIIKAMAAPNPNLSGDLNNDNTVNITDLSILLSNYGTTNATADINGDGTVNILDLSILLSHYGQSYSGSAQPAPIAGQGYHLAFDDEFTTLDRSIWDDHIWYDDLPSAAWTGFQEVDSSGILHLRTARSFLYPGCTANCYPINTITTQTSGKTFTQGYFEARMKWTGGHGAWPGFWLFSYRHATNPSWPSINPYCAQHSLPPAQCYSAELDAFEGQGSEPQSFYGTIHRNSSNDYGIADDQNGNNFQDAGVDLTAGFHDYGMLWTATQISWYLDGRLLMSAPVYDSTNQPMYLLLQMWVGGWTFDTDATTPATIETQVDWVHVWQK